MRDLTDKVVFYTLFPSRESAISQLEEEFENRGLVVADRYTKDALWFEASSSSYHTFTVCGRPDLFLTIDPYNWDGERREGGQPYWVLHYTLDVYVKHDPEDPFRVNRIHEKTASVLLSLGFSMCDEEDAIATRDGSSEHQSTWERRVDSVERTVDIIEALLPIESSQYPDGDQWMGGDAPPCEDPLLDDDEDEEPPAHGGCPRVVATGKWYWIAAVYEGGPIRLVGPCAELAATVYANGNWVAHRLNGTLKGEGSAKSIQSAMRAAKKMARSG